MTKRIYLSPPDITGNELKYIHEAFEENWVAPVGPNINLFEEEFTSYVQSDGGTAMLNSGTAALHLALILLGIGKGDKVVVSDFTFAASVNPILYVGAEPVFIDSEKETWNICPELLEGYLERQNKQNKLPKAIVIVHLYGHVAQMEKIMALSKKYGVPLVEDAAEALGSTYRGRALGTFGDFGVFSFNGNKIITTSGGGCLVGKNASQIQKARFLATQAKEDKPYYYHEEIGFNYRMSNVSAGIGRGQLEQLDDKVKKRRAIFYVYKDAFSGDERFMFPREIEGGYYNRWLTCVLLKDISPEVVVNALEKENIEARRLWYPMHLQPIFSEFEFLGSGVSKELFEQGVCLPSGSSITSDEQERVISAIKKM